MRARRLLLALLIPAGLLLAALVAEVRGQPAAPTGVLNDADRQWLASVKTLRVAPDPDFAPVEFFDSEGGYCGIAADYLEIIKRELGLHIEVVHAKNWSDVLAMGRSREIDMFGAATPTPQRGEYMRFSRPYVEFPAVIIVRKNVTEPLTLDRLTGMKVAVVSRYADHDFIVNNYPLLDLDPVPNVEIGLRKVSSGMVDAFVCNLATATYYIETTGIANLKIAGKTGFYHRLAFAVRSDWPELVTILDKALDGIDSDTRDTIYRKWIRLDQSPFSSREFWVKVIVGFVAILAAFFGVLVWNRSLRIRVDQKTRELQLQLAERARVEQELLDARVGLERAVEARTAELRKTNEQLQVEMRERKLAEDALRSEKEFIQTVVETARTVILVLDLDGHIVWYNAYLEEISGFPLEKMKGRDWFSTFLPETDREEVRQVFHLSRSGVSGKRVCNPVIARDGGTRMVEWYDGLLRDANGTCIGVLAVGQDITERKFAEEELRRSGEQLRFLSSRLLSVQEEERKRIAREVHDSIGSCLTGIKLGLEHFALQLARGPKSQERMDSLIATTRQAMRECRRIMTDLRPSILDDYGIVATMEWTCEQFRVLHPDVSVFEYITVSEGDVPETLKVVIFRIFQEALHNCGKYSRADRVGVGLRRENGELVLEVKDNGVGFHLEEALGKVTLERGLGLTSMEERTQLSGGEFAVESTPGVGTTVRASWGAGVLDSVPG